jgi:hypothetical protein
MADEQHLPCTRLLAVVGPSGSGKSSVVMAGLLPRLQEGGLPGSQRWVYLDPILPGAHPLDALAVAFARYLPDRSLKTLREDLEDDSTSGLHLLASLLGKPPETRVVLSSTSLRRCSRSRFQKMNGNTFLTCLLRL